MEKVIIYLDADGNPVMLIPSREALSRYTIEAIAEKDVPSGTSYKIVYKNKVPDGWTSSASWTRTVQTLGSGVGGPVEVFRDNPSHPDYVPAS